MKTCKNVVGGLLLGACAAVSNAHAQAPFSPDRCTSGERGYVYWAARSEVFRFRFDATQPLYPRTGQDPKVAGAPPGIEDVPPAPEPHEPEGCYGNPLRGGYVPYMDQHAMDLFRSIAGRPMDKASPRAWSRGYFALSERLLSHSRENSAAAAFARGHACRQRSPQVQQCMHGSSSKRPNFGAIHVLKIEAEVLRAPAARTAPFHVVLSPAMGSAHLLSAETAIDVYQAVRLKDDFRITPQEIEYLPSYYRGLVQYLVEARVPDYQWKR